MAKKRELKLNSLSRYTKQSPKYVLEEHSHCEVPAGCGGVVLRWSNPQRSIPIALWHEVIGEFEFFVDGVRPASGRPMFEYGEHVFGFRISGIDPNHGILMFAGIYDEKEQIHTGISMTRDQRIYILSLGDGTWKFTDTEPLDDSWLRSEYDDSHWQPMIATAFPETNENDRSSYRVKKMQDFGAKAIGIADGAEAIWVRKSFSIATRLS